MNRWYIGDGIAGFRYWLYARVLYRLLPWQVANLLAPKLPEGWSYCVRVDGRGLYARHWQ